MHSTAIADSAIIIAPLVSCIFLWGCAMVPLHSPFDVSLFVETMRGLRTFLSSIRAQWSRIQVEQVFFLPNHSNVCRGRRGACVSHCFALPALPCCACFALPRFAMPVLYPA